MMIQDLILLLIKILAICLVAYIIKLIFQLGSDIYVKKNKDDLFEKTQPSSSQCLQDLQELLEDQSTYDAYVDELKLNDQYNCSNQIVASASNAEIKYLMKYSNIDNDMNTLEKLDYCADWLKQYDKTMGEMQKLEIEVKGHLPLFVKVFASKKKIPFKVCGISYDLAKKKKPVFTFSYTSPGGKVTKSYDVHITPETILKIESAISERINKKGHMKAQRSAMTPELRAAILQRDNYTCCRCGNSLAKEPNLLLEVDHIIPVSKGGKTEWNNLQTLCWRCNRAKSDKM